MKNKFLLLIVLALIIGLFILGPLKKGFDNNERSTPQNKEKTKEQSIPPSDGQNRSEGFNRRISNLVYTEHARCRMACRHIDENEVKEILEKGRINYPKSDTAARPDPKYALEGITSDAQNVRIIFAPTERGILVITVIDLGRDWSCHCK